VSSVAREKAAAARSGRPLVCGVRPGEPGFDEIESACRDADAPLLVRGRDFGVEDVVSALDERGRARTSFVLVADGRSVPLTSPLLGRHQAENAAVAAMLTRVAGLGVEDAHIRQGIANAAPPARLQTLDHAPLTLLDGAHSPASFRALAATVRDAGTQRPRVFVVGMAADKDVAGALAELRDVADVVVATTSGAVRAAEPEDLAALAQAAGIEAVTCASFGDAVTTARERAGPSGTVVVTGSLYLCGAVLAAR